MVAKILVVDDEEDFTEFVSHHLKAHGYQVITAVNGLEALNQARRFLPDLVLLDLMLSDMDGYSVCELLRCQPSTATIPVIMMTALAGELARCNGLAAGADDFLHKPFSPKRLITRVKKVLEYYEERVQMLNPDGQEPPGHFSFGC